MDKAYKSAIRNIRMMTLIPSLMCFFGYIQGGPLNLFLDTLLFSIIFVLVYTSLYFLQNIQPEKINLNLILLLPTLLLFTLELNSFFLMIELIVFNHLLIFTPRNNKDTISLKDSIFKYLWQYIPLLNKLILIISVITFFVFEWYDIDFFRFLY